MISILVILGLVGAFTLPVAFGYAGMLTAAMAAVFYGALYMISSSFRLLSEAEAEDTPWRSKHDKAS